MTSKLVDGIVFICVLVAFYSLYCIQPLMQLSLKIVLFMVVNVIMVLALKGFRLYFLLYGTQLKFINFLVIYCKTTIVSLFLPYKLGDFYKVYCYGRSIQNFWLALIVVLVDRVLDTIGLLLVIIVLEFNNQTHIPVIVWNMVGFIVLMAILYYLLLPIVLYWKHYFLIKPVTTRYMNCIKLLDSIDEGIVCARKILREKLSIGVGISILSWGLEISLFALNGREGILKNILDYLQANISNTFNQVWLYNHLISFFVLLLLCVVMLIYQKRVNS